jgi:FtsP/CotA-like multicopper oxidase with cupredoxin domain
MRTLAFSLLLLTFAAAFAAPASAKATDGGVCPRPAAGSTIVNPPDLASSNGVLKVTFHYLTSVDDAGRTLFCFVTDGGLESPTLHVNPGDTLKITLVNMIPDPKAGAEFVSNTGNTCGAATMDPTSVNMHFHGTNVSPKCHSDEVIHTLVNSGETFTYTIKFPANEPPGLYWYHPHVHGLAEDALLGGATGAIEVEGIANIQPAVSGLPERFFVFRDQVLAHTGSGAPGHDVSVNYVPVPFPDFTPGVIQTGAGTQEFWRVVNASADTEADLEIVYDRKAQPLQIVALDGVPTGSQDGKRQGTIVHDNDVFLPPGGRAEFIVTTPSASVKTATLVTKFVDTGHGGDATPQRTLATIAAGGGTETLPRLPKTSGPPNKQRFEDLAYLKPTAQRLLYFSQAGGNFFITVDGQAPHAFDPNEPPAIVTNVGAVEDWTVENRAPEVHEFHIHQIHFLVTAVNGVAIPRKKQQFYDTYQVDAWPGGGTYPSITARLDFRGAVVGDFVYHCHILNHEDHGMMAIIEVDKKARAKH